MPVYCTSSNRQQAANDGCLPPACIQALSPPSRPCAKAAHGSSQTASCWGSTARPGTRSVCSAQRANSRSLPPATAETPNSTARATTSSKTMPPLLAHRVLTGDKRWGHCRRHRLRTFLRRFSVSCHVWLKICRPALLLFRVRLCSKK